MRGAAVMLLVTVVLALYAYIQPDNSIEYYDSVNAYVVNTKAHYHSGHLVNGRGSRAYYTYTVKFRGAYQNGGEFSLEQNTSESLYNYYSSLIGYEPMPMTLYQTSDNKYYLTEKIGSAATREYHLTNASISSRFSMSAVLITLLITVILIGMGLAQMRISLKYPRTDIPLDPTELAAKQKNDDLMKEFDAAYAKFTAQKKAGLQPDDGTVRNLPDGSTERKQLK